MTTSRVHYKTLTLAIAASLALAACAKKEEILQGERLSLRGEAEEVVEVAEVTQLAAPTQQNYAQWTHKNGSTAHRVAHPALGTALTRAWSANIGSGNGKKARITSDPIVAAGRVFTMDSNSQVRAFSTSGTPVWVKDLTPPWDKGGAASGGGIAYGNGLIVATTGFGEVIAIDPASGAIKWRHKTDASISAAPLVIDGLIIAVNLNNKAIALDVANGRIQWEIRSGGPATGLSGAGAPAAVGEFLALPFSSGELVGANVKTGARTWSAAVSGGGKGNARGFVGAISSDPVITGDTVYAANQAGRLISANRETGERNWTVNEGSYGPVWATGDSLFLVTDQFQLKRLRAADGLEMWAVPLPGYLKDGKRRREANVHYGPVLAGNRLVVAGSDGQIRSFNASTGAALGNVQIPGGAASQPAIVSGTMYILSGNGQLHAFK
ncbi:PQQ-binding-like beta-propeller repeat protein [Amylibacter sp. SFDW26]|uniref:PQQ-like beta-propeller repeat protein n=1 Tax=Amylibacter sp. SFDW26 TaxID=2652722 RepID=UPI0012626FCB|nr:PQQ-like beta-propeller repeat protein [Amylibacter sp. SFDW26]KAB7616235.1 PQQ-binding-like beta-propeller repeat protein [Amylibacter sp. SFDW26]